MIQNSLLFFILGYISAYLVRHYANKKIVDDVEDVTDAIAEFRELDKKHMGEFISINKTENRIKNAKGDLTLDDVLDQDGL